MLCPYIYTYAVANKTSLTHTHDASPVSDCTSARLHLLGNMPERDDEQGRVQTIGRNGVRRISVEVVGSEEKEAVMIINSIIVPLRMAMYLSDRLLAIHAKSIDTAIASSRATHHRRAIPQLHPLMRARVAAQLGSMHHLPHIHVERSAHCAESLERH
jgi:hypothetical protein